MFKKTNNQTTTKIEKTKYRNRRSEGDQLMYYVLYSMLSMILFLMIASSLDFFDLRSDQISYLFSLEFLSLTIIVFLIQVLTNILGRILGYIMIRLIYRHSANKTIYELNSHGINRIGLRFVLSTFLSSLLWTLGAMVIIQNQLFGSNDVISLILTYIIVNVILFIITKLIVDTKT